MKHILLLHFALITFSSVKALKCMTCYGKGFEECDINGHVTECLQNQLSCETVIRRYDEKLTVEKRCKDSNACRNNQFQNDRSSGGTTQCNSDQTNSFCTCCCEGDMCNAGIPSCYRVFAPLLTVNDCPAQEQAFPHGNMNCFGGEQQNQICQFECTSQDYSVYPKYHDTAVCTRNATWSINRPCCARPCPPHFLYDAVSLVHFTSSIGPFVMAQFFKDFHENLVLGWDGIQESVMFYGAEPIVDSVVKFNEYGLNLDRLDKLLKERSPAETPGPANLGAAIRYAMKNLFTDEAGMRDSRVPKLLAIFTDTNPNDDALAAARVARDLGYVVYIHGFQPAGSNSDRTTFDEIAGNPEHVFIWDGNNTESNIEDMAKHFCNDPCVHVLHSHP